jgi:hypothetical protein
LTPPAYVQRVRLPASSCLIEARSSQCVRDQKVNQTVSQNIRGCLCFPVLVISEPIQGVREARRLQWIKTNNTGIVKQSSTNLFEGRIIRYGNKKESCKEGRQESCKEGDQKSNQEEVVNAAYAASGE